MIACNKPKMPMPLTNLVRTCARRRRSLSRLLATALLLFASSVILAQTPQTPEEPPVTTESEPATSEDVEPEDSDAEDAQHETGAAEPLPYISRTARNEQLLAASLPEDALWLEDDHEPILALFRPTETAVTKGVVLFLHATETPPEWPALLENARRNLPQYGWATLALTLPPRTPPAPAPRDLPLPDTPDDPPADPELLAEIDSTAEDTVNETASTSSNPEVVATPEVTAPVTNEAVEEIPVADTEAEPASEDATPEDAVTEEKPLLTRSEIIHKRFAAAQSWLAQTDYRARMLVVDNSSVMEVAAYLQTQPAGTVTALILVNLQPQEALSTAQLNQLFSELALPVLDVFPAPAHAAMTAQRQRHRGAALRNQVPDYHQMLLPPQQKPLQDDNKNFWVERLRGFMERQK